MQIRTDPTIRLAVEFFQQIRREKYEKELQASLLERDLTKVPISVIRKRMYCAPPLSFSLHLSSISLNPSLSSVHVFLFTSPLLPPLPLSCPYPLPHQLTSPVLSVFLSPSTSLFDSLSSSLHFFLLLPSPRSLYPSPLSLHPSLKQSLLHPCSLIIPSRFSASHQLRRPSSF